MNQGQINPEGGVDAQEGVMRESLNDVQREHDLAAFQNPNRAMELEREVC